jgi:hypothetical protein
MPRLSNQQIISSLQNGEESVMFYLSKRYFESARKLLRRKGCRDKDTPAVFSRILVGVCREIQRNKISPNVDFEHFLFNSIRDYISDMKTIGRDALFIPGEREIVASCFSILDESSRKILSARYCENLTFEQIAARLEYSNPVIAHFEFNKAFSLFENIVRARLNVQSN